jgi:dihydrofolate reductase
MTRVNIRAFTVSLDGYGAGPAQDRQNPLGIGGEELHEWMFPTQTFMAMQRKTGGTTGVDNDLVAQSMANVGAWIMGRNMFASSRGPWLDDAWKGWWGENPPYHGPVFVLTHHARKPIEMKGGTTFHFVTDGIHAALDRARGAAGDKDIRILGGVSVLRQYLSAGLVDDAHLAFSPRLLGSGESLFAGLDLVKLGYSVTEHVNSERALHVTLRKAGR